MDRATLLQVSGACGSRRLTHQRRWQRLFPAGDSVANQVKVTSVGVVHDWPTGFSTALPQDHWMVVHVHPRQEKKTIEALRARQLPGVAFFERRLRHYPGKGTQESLVPLIAGYLFVAGGHEEHEAIYATRRVVRIIEVPRPQELTTELRSLIALVNASTTPLVVRPELTPGKRISITTGTFAGCSGVIDRRRRDFELVVNLELLGSSVSVTLPAEYAELTAAD